MAWLEFSPVPPSFKSVLFHIIPGGARNVDTLSHMARRELERALQCTLRSRTVLLKGDQTVLSEGPDCLLGNDTVFWRNQTVIWGTKRSLKKRPEAPLNGLASSQKGRVVHSRDGLFTVGTSCSL